MLGVAVGVLVLIVVLSVMAGFEREVKTRVLGFSAHVELHFAPFGQPAVIQEWGAVSEAVEQVEGVEEAYAQVRDFTILEMEDMMYPIEYRAIDTRNEKQMAALDELILKDKYGGNADMGLDQKAVVAETTADQFGIAVGDFIRLHSARNLQSLAEAYKITDRELVAVEFADLFATVRKDLREKMSVEEGREGYAFDDLKAVYEAIDSVQVQKIRESERELLVAILILLNSGEPDATGDRRLLPAGTVAQVEAHLDELDEMDRLSEDGRLLKGLREVALPKELEVIGIFKVSTHVVHPKVFVPLATGQELKNLSGGVETIGVRVTDPYKVAPVRDRIAAVLPEHWIATTWMDENREFVELIAKERVMMYFALSFIMLVSAFCIGAVMFTVTIQKKQEIGVMKALGAIPVQVVRVFIYQGMIIGFIGALLGVGLGLLVIRYRDPIHGAMKTIGFDFFPAGFHYMDSIPARVNPVEVGAIAAGAFVLCTLATILPAMRAARTDAARCLRNL